MDKLFILAFCIVAFVGIGAFVLSSFSPEFMQPMLDSVNFSNPLLMILVLLGFIGAAAWVFTN